MLKVDTKYCVAVAAVVLGFLVLGSAETVPADESLVFPPNSVPFGHTYPRWAEKWQQWALSIPVPTPVSTHPLFDPDGDDCSVGQTGPVFFLGGRVCSNTDEECDSSEVERTCTVPRGKALLFPIVNALCSILEGADNRCAATVPGNRQIVKDAIDLATNLSADITLENEARVPIPNLLDYRVKSRPFRFTLPEDHLLTAIEEGIGGPDAEPFVPFPAGTYFPAVDEGVYLMVMPLPVGTHTLHWHGEFHLPGFDFVLNVTYTIIVE